MKFKEFYHVTTPQRAKQIQDQGFNDNLRFNYRLSRDGTSTRTYICRKRNLRKWIRILTKEQGWGEIAILKVSIPISSFERLLKQNIDDWTVPFISDLEDQLIVQVDGSLKDQFGIKIELFKMVKIE